MRPPETLSKAYYSVYSESTKRFFLVKDDCTRETDNFNTLECLLERVIISEIPLDRVGEYPPEGLIQKLEKEYFGERIIPVRVDSRQKLAALQAVEEQAKEQLSE